MNQEDTIAKASNEPKKSIKTTLLGLKKHVTKRSILIAALSAVVIVGFIVSWSFTTKSPLSDIVLSNGKEIRLGSSVEQVEQKLGSDIRKVDDTTYEYPGNNNVTNPLQARLFIRDNKLVAIRLRANKANLQKATGIHPRMPVSEVGPKTKNKAQQVGEPLKGGIVQGYMYADQNVVSYYLVNPCGGLPDEVVLVALALKGYEQVAKDIGAGCGVRI